MKNFAEACDAVIKAAIKDLKEKIWACRSVVEEKEQWNFEGLDGESALLETLHGIRFMLSKLPTISWSDDDDATELTTFTNNLSKWEKALAEYLEGKSAPQA